MGDHLQYDFGMRAMKTFIHNLSKKKTYIRKEE